MALVATISPKSQHLQIRGEGQQSMRRGRTSYARLACVAVVAHGYLTRGAAGTSTERLKTSVWRHSGAVSAAAEGEAAGGGRGWDIETVQPGSSGQLNTRRVGGSSSRSSRNGADGLSRDFPMAVAGALFDIQDAALNAQTAAAGNGATVAAASAFAAGVTRVVVVGVETGDRVARVGAPPSSRRRRMQQGTPAPGGGGNNVGDDLVSGDEDALKDTASAEQQRKRDEMFVAISIVIGCGVLALVLLCIVRNVMDLCLLRNDPTGRLGYSQEEGLSKRSIERLPQTRYKKPSTSTGAAAARKKAVGKDPPGSREEGNTGAAVVIPGAGVGPGEAGSSAEAGQGAAVTESQGGRASVASAGIVARGSGGGTGDRDSTADMCAICLVEYESGDELRVIPGCDHHFHKECIDPWLETKAVCAYCKAKVEAKATCCDRAVRSVSNRLGLNLVAPTTIRFSSSRRTYTNEDLQLAMGPSLPASYGRSDVDYVGSAVAPRQSSIDLEAGGRAAPAAALAGVAAAGSTRGVGGLTALSGSSRSLRMTVVMPDERGAPEEGTVVVQPASAPSYVVVPREYHVGDVSGGDEGGGRGGRGGSARNSVRQLRVSSGGGATISYDSSRSSLGRWGTADAQAAGIDTGGGEEKGEAAAAAAAEEPWSRRSGVSDGLGGVVFGGNTEEYREAEAAASMQWGVAENLPPAAPAASVGGGDEQAGSGPRMQEVVL